MASLLKESQAIIMLSVARQQRWNSYEAYLSCKVLSKQEVWGGCFSGTFPCHTRYVLPSHADHIRCMLGGRGWGRRSRYTDQFTVYISRQNSSTLSSVIMATIMSTHRSNKGMDHNPGRRNCSV